MYTIRFEGVPFASVLDIETACALALSVHRSSNISHIIDVVDSAGVITISFTLSREKAAILNNKG